MAGNITLFTNDSGAAAGPIDYVKDAFLDASLPASDNSGLTDSASTNPLGDQFANDDCPKFGPKTLFIKDLVLIEDRSKWVNHRPTYRVIFTENFPAAHAYIFGDFSIAFKRGQNLANNSGQIEITMKTIGDGIGVSGILRRAAFIVQGNTAAAATGQLITDGVNGSTVDFSSQAANQASSNNAANGTYIHSGTSEAYGLHDFRLTALQASTLTLVGIVGYFENSTQSIDVAPGVSYVDKSKITTTSGASFLPAAMGSSLGGNILVYKTQTSGYTMSVKSIPTITSIAQGASGTNLLSVSTGHGASFPQGSGVVIAQGTSMYVGSVVGVSTDTLTVSPTLSFGITNSIYRSWQSGPTLSINASLMTLASTIDFSKYSVQNGISGPILDPYGRFAFWGSNLQLSTNSGATVLLFGGASGYFQCDGNFQAAEIEMIGGAIFHATLSVNGTPGWGANTGQTGAVKRTVFTDGGAGWNSFVFSPGASLGTIGIAKINLYQKNRDIGVTYGALAHFPVNQAFTERSTINATLMALGTERRHYADQILFKGPWVRSLSSTASGGHIYTGSTTTCSFSFQYYGKNFALLGTAPSSATLAIDTVGTAATFNAIKTVGSEAWHTIAYSHVSGTSIINAFDIQRTYGGLSNVQNVIEPKPVLNTYPKTKSVVKIAGSQGNGSGNTAIRNMFNAPHINSGTAITYAASATLGDSFTINEDGYYTFIYSDNLSSGIVNIGLSLNSSQLSSDIQSITAADRLISTAVAASNVGSVTWTGFLPAGSIVRPHTSGTPNANSASAVLTAEKID